MSWSWRPPEAGGRNLGVRPMEMLLLGVGGCSNFDVVSILKSPARPWKAANPSWKPSAPLKTPGIYKIHMHFVGRAGAEEAGHVRSNCRREILLGVDHAGRGRCAITQITKLSNWVDRQTAKEKGLIAPFVAWIRCT